MGLPVGQCSCQIELIFYFAIDVDNLRSPPDNQLA
jgi:hypothetical protein